MTINAMSMTPAATGGRILRGILTRLVQKVRRLWEAHLTRQELHGLPDEVLRDIGITRCEINFLALSTTAPDDAGPKRRARFGSLRGLFRRGEGAVS